MFFLEICFGKRDFFAYVLTFVVAPSMLVPMIILRFPTTAAWTLSTVSIAVILFFSIILGIFTDQSDAEHVMAVAAYAAVMVVFVGTS